MFLAEWMSQLATLGSSSTKLIEAVDYSSDKCGDVDEAGPSHCAASESISHQAWHGDFFPAAGSDGLPRAGLVLLGVTNTRMNRLLRFCGTPSGP